MKHSMLSLGDLAPSPKFIEHVEEFGAFVRRQFPRGEVCREIYIGIGEEEFIECMGFDISDFINDYGFSMEVWETVVNRLMGDLGATFAAIGVPLNMEDKSGHPPIFAEGNHFVAIGATERIAVCKQRIPIYTHKKGSQIPGLTYVLGIETYLDDLMVPVRRNITQQG